MDEAVAPVGSLTVVTDDPDEAYTVVDPAAVMALVIGAGDPAADAAVAEALAGGEAKKAGSISGA